MVNGLLKDTLDATKAATNVDMRSILETVPLTPADESWLLLARSIDFVNAFQTEDEKKSYYFRVKTYVQDIPL